MIVRWLLVSSLCLGAIFSSPCTASAAGPSTTVRGIAQPTKDGLYVDGVVIAEEVLPKGLSVDALAGKMVEVKGIVRTTTHVEDDGPPSQHRPGTWQYMEKVESVKVVPAAR